MVLLNQETVEFTTFFAGSGKIVYIAASSSTMVYHMILKYLPYMEIPTYWKRIIAHIFTQNKNTCFLL